MIKIMLTSTWNKGIERARQRSDVLFKTIERLTRECDDKDTKLHYARQEIVQLQTQLEEARKNDHRNHLGRFVSAKELNTNDKK
jgi:hypothetical protein